MQLHDGDELEVEQYQGRFKQLQGTAD